MKIQEAVSLYQAMQNDLFKGLKGAKFNYALKRNREILKKELQTVEDSFVSNPDYEKLEEERINMLSKYVERDDKGNPVVESDGNFKIKEGDKEKFNSEFDPIRENYILATKDQQKRVQEFTKMVEETDIPFELHSIKLNDIPEDISQEQMDFIYPLIIEG